MNKVDIKLINAFLERDRQNIKADLESYKDLYCAATSYNSSNIKHGHQRRINPNILKEFAQKVLEKETELENANVVTNTVGMFIGWAIWKIVCKCLRTCLSEKC